MRRVIAIPDTGFDGARKVLYRDRKKWDDFAICSDRHNATPHHRRWLIRDVMKQWLEVGEVYFEFIHERFKEFIRVVALNVTTPKKVRFVYLKRRLGAPIVINPFPHHFSAPYPAHMFG